MVSFVDRERFLGEGARTKAQTNVKNTVTDIKRLIGRRWDDPELQEELKYLPFTVLPSDDGGILVQVTYNGARHTFTPVQVLGMLLSNFKNNADREVGGSNPDVVISVPAYYTDAQRRQMLHAADIAGLKVLRLINETCAAALAYGLPKSSEFPEDSAKPTTVVFFDLGQSACTASAVQFNKSKLKVIGTAFNRNLGGRNFDDLLVKKLVEVPFGCCFQVTCTNVSRRAAGVQSEVQDRLHHGGEGDVPPAHRCSQDQRERQRHGPSRSTAALQTMRPSDTTPGVPKMMMSLDCLIGEKDVQVLRPFQYGYAVVIHPFL